MKENIRAQVLEKITPINAQRLFIKVLVPHFGNPLGAYTLFCRRVSTIVASGNLSFLDLLSLSATSDERIIQLFHVLNNLFAKHKESRRRHLAFHTPTIITVKLQVCMIEDDLIISTYGEVYEISCARHHFEIDHPIIHFKRNLNQFVIGHLSPASVAEL